MMPFGRLQNLRASASATTVVASSSRIRTGRWRRNHNNSGTATTTTAVDERGSSVIGFIGLGQMGLPMAMNLVQKGVPVVAFDRHALAREAARHAGIQLADSTREIAEQHDCHFIFTMLPTCQAVDAVMTDLVDCWNPKSGAAVVSRKMVIDCSTVSPTTSRKWHAIWTDNGHSMLDAPVSGGVKGASDGTLTFMVGCTSEQELARARFYLEKMGKSAIACGGPGAGSATKLCNNLALAAQMIGICEAMNLGEALGVDPVVLAEVMNSSTAKCWSSEVNNPHPAVALAKRTGHADGTVVGMPASCDYEGGFATRLMLKDLGLAVGAADQVRVALPITTVARQLYQLAELRGFANKDFGVMLRFLQGR
jgi:3-hydroxyisobutyrate dehydrogenase